MAKIADVLATERNRQQPTEWNKIHLFQMGDFYRAYEWSAWLIVAITYSDKVRHQQQGDRKPLKVSKKTLASGGSDFCFVGFPIKSLEKFVPERTDAHNGLLPRYPQSYRQPTHCHRPRTDE